MKRQEKKGLFSKQNLISLFIIFIMITSVLGYMAGKTGIQKEKYNGYSFIKKNSVWTTTIDKKEFNFNYLPSAVELIKLNESIKNRLTNTAEIDSASDLDDPYTETIALVQHNLNQELNSRNIFLRTGLTKENKYNLAIITCNDATPQIPVLYFKKSNQTSISLEDNCIIAEAESESDLIKIKDRILYSILDII